MELRLTKATLKMKIMHISPLESHPCFSDLIEEQKKKHEVIFVKLSFAEQGADYEIVENADKNYIEIKNIKKICDQSYDEKVRMVFDSLLKKYKPDLVHIQVFSGISLLPILNVASSLGIKKVLTLHDYLFCLRGVCHNGNKKCELDSLDECDCGECIKFAARGNEPLASYNKSRKIWVEDIINQCDRIICPSKYQKEQLEILFGKNDRIVVSYYGLKLPPYTPKKRGPFQVVFGYLGTLWPMKGVSLIESALERLQKENFKMLMGIECRLGNDFEREYLKKLQKNDKVILKKDIGREKLYDEFFSQIDYLIIPSLWEETGPMTLLESSYYHIPVIINNNKSMIEKIKENGGSKVFKDSNELIEIMEDIIRGKIKSEEVSAYTSKDINQYNAEIESVYMEEIARPPRDLSIRLSFKCNQNCNYCVVGELMNNSNLEEPLDFERVRRDLRENKKRYDNLEICGGEPTILKDFFKIVNLAYRLGYQIELVTNGRIFSYEDFCKRLLDYNLKLILITLHANNPEVHDAITRVNGSFRQTVKGIKNLKKHCFNVLGQILLMKSNYTHLLETVKFMEGLGVDGIRFTFLEPHGSAELDFYNIVPKYSEVLPFMDEALEWLKTRNTRIEIKTFPYCCISPQFRTFLLDPVMITTILTYINKETTFQVSKFERVFNLKEKFDFCDLCKYNEKCEGVWKDYVSRYGKEEFKPIE